MTGRGLRSSSATGTYWEPSTTGNSREPVGGTRNGVRYPPFQRLDLSVSRRFDRGRLRLDPYLQLVHAYNAHNVFTYVFDYGSNPPTRRGYSQFPVLPTIGLTASW